MNTLWDTAYELRALVMREGLDFKSTRGLEVGPLAHPIVLKDDGEIIYVDHTDTLSLRQTYEASGFADRIVGVDAIWGTESLLSCIGGQQVDYIMASHVAEHVPDLITWLVETREALRPGGQLRLALPDLRFSNDVLRPPTRISDLLTAWLLKARRPQLRDVLDFRLHEALGVDGAGFYYGRASRDDVRPVRSIADALDCARMVQAEPESYFDVHCLAASAFQFASLMEQLADAGLLTMACARMIDTAPPLFEFYAFLTPNDDAKAVKDSWTAAKLSCRDPLPGSVEGITARHMAQPASSAAELARMSEKLVVSEAQVAALRADLATLQGFVATQAAEVANTIREMTEAIAYHQAEVTQARTAAEELRQGLALTERHVAAIHKSLSWRITTPLRSFKRIFLS